MKQIAKPGRPPYGAHTEEQLTLDRIAAMRRCGLSWSVIASRLNKAGARTRTGKPWTRVSVADRWRAEAEKKGER